MNQHLQILNRTDDTQRLVGQAYSLTYMTAFIIRVVYRGSNMMHKSTLDRRKQSSEGDNQQNEASIRYDLSTKTTKSQGIIVIDLCIT